MTFRQRILLGLLIAAQLAVPLAVLPLIMHTEVLINPFVLPLLGLMAGQIGLLAVWLRLVDLPVVARIIGVTLAGSAYLVALLIGVRLAGGGPASVGDVIFVTGMAVFAVFMTVCWLWAIWYCRQWRIALPDDAYEHPRQFRLQQVFVLISLVAMLLAAARLVEWDWSMGRREFQRVDAGEFLFMALVLAVYTFVELLISLPVLARCFGPRTDLDHTVTVCIVAPAMAALPFLPVFFGIALVYGVNDGLFEVLFIAIVPFHLGQLLALAGTLIALRQIGFRLEREFRP